MTIRVSGERFTIPCAVALDDGPGGQRGLCRGNGLGNEGDGGPTSTVTVPLGMRHSGEFPTRTKNNRTLRQTLLELQILQNNRTHPLVPQYYVFIDRKSTVYPVGSAPREFLTFSYHGGGNPTFYSNKTPNM